MKIEVKLTEEEIRQACLEYIRKSYPEITPDTHYCSLNADSKTFIVTATIGEVAKR